MSASRVSGVNIVALIMGSVLLRDEGAGIHATRFLERSPSMA